MLYSVERENGVEGDKTLPSWFAEAETLKIRILDRLEGMSQEDRRVSLRPGDWSAAQVVEHLVLVEERLVDDWRVAAQKSPAVKPSWKGALIVSMVNFAMASPLRLPTVPTLEPEESRELLALSDRWGLVRQRLPGTFPPDGTRLWIVHPIFGPLSCPQMGTFLVAHLRHHLKHWPK